MDITTLVNLTSKAWALPILSSLHSGVAGRQATLLIATGASRTAFAQSMEHLIKIGLMERNPGHGHPLRPEFRLTERGKYAAAVADKIQRVSAEEEKRLLRKTWTVPVLTTLHTPTHYSDIKRGLQTITDRALSQSLKSLESNDWVLREIDETSRPPRSIYRAINTGGQISQITAQAFHQSI